MKIKLDESLPTRLREMLSGLGHDVDTVVDEGLGGTDDATLWETAQRGTRFLITQDLDFSDIRKFQPGTHGGILLVRLRDPSRRCLVERVHGIFSSEPVGAWAGCFVVATEHRLRVTRPA